VTPKPEQEAFVALQQSASVLLDGVARLLKEYGLSATQFNVLRILRGARPTPLACGEIASRMLSRDPDMTRLLDRMEKQGWISRCRQDGDRRVVRVAITDAGLAILKSLDAPILVLHRSQFARLGDRKTAALTRLLSLLLES
jgi:DNA-binding MarR family transcriptional regulator